MTLQGPQRADLTLRQNLSHLSGPPRGFETDAPKLETKLAAARADNPLAQAPLAADIPARLYTWRPAAPGEVAARLSEPVRRPQWLGRRPSASAGTAAWPCPPFRQRVIGRRTEFDFVDLGLFLRRSASAVVAYQLRAWVSWELRAPGILTPWI